MPSGGLLNLIRIIVASLILVGWVAWVGYRFAQGGLASDTSMFPVFIAAQWVAPHDFRLTRGFWALLFAALLAWVALFWRFGSVDYQRTAFLALGAVFALYVAAWLFDRGYRRWRTIQSPTTRLFVATVVLTTAFITGSAAIFYVLSSAAPAFGGGNTGVGWLVALVLNIPLFGLIAVGLHLRRTRNLKHDE